MTRLLVALALPLAAALAPGATAAGDEPYSAPLREASRQLLWGDTHLHTTQSPDAYIMGTRLDRDAAYRFARGETVIADNGMRVRLRRPLDFLAITDHAEYLGIFPRLVAEDDALSGWDFGAFLGGLLAAGEEEKAALEFSLAIQSDDDAFKAPEPARRTVWDEACAAADAFYEPGVFTTLIGYEWTSMITGDNLHRVVLFRDGAERASRVLPFTAQQSTAPEDLWDALAAYEASTGGDVLAIAHNGNVSNGRMFAPVKTDGEPLDAAYARSRARWEPVYEVTQVKGDGETHPFLSPADEFADFETWDDGNIALTADKEPEMLPHEYARSALKLGLGYRETLGVNPFKFGMIGSSDMHTGLATTAEDNYFGKFAHDEPSPERVRLKMAHQLQESWRLAAAGLAGVWAEDNTRESIFDAFRRREVYATTGSRIGLRFFAGWDFDPADAQRPDHAAIGYRKGVPMGSDLPPRGDAGAPDFLIVAARDPDGANLDRVQVVKGWLAASGEPRERVYDVALSDGRVVDPATGKAPPVGDTVDLEDASYVNSIGAPVLATVWTDPDFDPAQSAFYYVRVLQIPTPRWTLYDRRYLGSTLPEEAARSIQERAYSSPVWYTP